jgi:23S rRNA-/tRNA-specific pseudouridylate synthase
MYALDGGFRHVLPYFHSHTTSLKARWEGKPLISVLTSEFGRALPPALLTVMIEGGLVSVGGAPVRDPAFPLPPLRGPSKALVCRVHRHEPPVVDAPLLLSRAGGYVLVLKPPSWPCHPCGPQARNSLTRIMEAELGGGLRVAAADAAAEGGEGEGRAEEAPPAAEGGGGGGSAPLWMLFRLDRLVSGLLLFAASEAACAAFHASGAAGGTVKVYAARLLGRVEPRALAAARAGGGGVSLAAHDSWGALLRAWALGGEGRGVEAFVGAGPRWGAPELLRGSGGAEPVELCIDYPLLPAPGRRGGRFLAGAAGAGGGKACATRLVALRYCAASDTTLVLLRPLTGRTHQLRVHAMAVGHPVANCPVYGGAPRLLEDAGDALPHVATPGGLAALRAHVEAQRRDCEGGRAPAEDVAALAGCGFCRALEGEGEGGGGGGGGGPPRQPHRSLIWLHALCYAFEGHRFQAQLPPWWQ